MSRDRIGEIPAIRLDTQITFEAGHGFVTAVINFDRKTTIGLKFESLEQMLTFSVGLMEHAAIVWPNHPLVKMYQEE